MECFESSSVGPVIFCQGLGLGLETSNSISNNLRKFRVSLGVLWPEFLDNIGASASHTASIGTNCRMSAVPPRSIL